MVFLLLLAVDISMFFMLNFSERDQMGKSVIGIVPLGLIPCIIYFKKG